uniref:Chemokine interleukin-8-like domain-containing protein n=1 Tax=Cyprinus carpio TaxID=7962 RepID=A0A8C2KLQ5_CYPCA
MRYFPGLAPFLYEVTLTSSISFIFSAPPHIGLCCVEITNVKSPVKRLPFFFDKSCLCVFPFRFKTIAGKEICVDPETAWVSGHVDKVSKRTTTHTLMQILITYN